MDIRGFTKGLKKMNADQKRNFIKEMNVSNLAYLFSMFSFRSFLHYRSFQKKYDEAEKLSREKIVIAQNLYDVIDNEFQELGNTLQVRN